MNPKTGAITYDKLINIFHEANDLYDGKLIQFNLSVFATSSNDNYTYPQTMEKTDKDKFVGAMVVEVVAHKECENWKWICKNPYLWVQKHSQGPPCKFSGTPFPVLSIKLDF